MKKLFETSVLIAAAFFLVLSSGCSQPTKNVDSLENKNSIKISNVENFKPIFFNFRIFKDNRINIGKIEVKEWEVMNKEGNVQSKYKKHIGKGVLYLYTTDLQKKLDDYVLTKFSDIQKIEQTFFEHKSRPAEVKLILNNGVMENIKDIRIMSCPEDSKPSVDTCLLAQRGVFTFQIERRDLYVRNFDVTNNFIGETFHTPISLFREFGKRYIDESVLPEIYNFNQHGLEEKFTEISNLWDSHAETRRISKERNKKEKVKEGIANQNAIIADKNNKIAHASIGSSTFCNSGTDFLVMPGKNISQVLFTCDLTGDNTVWLSEYMNKGWDIVSESRTSQETFSGGVGDVISIRLKRISKN